MWRVEGDSGRWAEMSDSGRFAADAATLDGVHARRGAALLVTPTGPGHEYGGDDDSVWHWLAAEETITGPVRLVAGSAPVLPIPAPVEGAVY